MASHALSKRRGYKPRPDVCLTHPNPGRCEPPPPEDFPRSCVATPSDFTINVEEQEPVEWHACSPHLPDAEALTFDITAVFGVITPGDHEGDNCSDDEQIEYEAPGDPGTDTITCVCTFSDAGTVNGTANVTIEEENGD